MADEEIDVLKELVTYDGQGEDLGKNGIGDFVLLEAVENLVEERKLIKASEITDKIKDLKKEQKKASWDVQTNFKNRWMELQNLLKSDDDE